MLGRQLFRVCCAIGLLLGGGTAAASQKPAPTEDATARIAVYVEASAPEGDASAFTLPGTDAKGIADSVKDIQDALTSGKTRWVRQVADRASAVVVVGVTRRTYDDGPEIMSVYTDVSIGDYTFTILGVGDPWRDAARSMVRQLDQWVGANQAKLRERMPGHASSDD